MFRLPLYYELRINKNIEVLMANLNEVLVILNWDRYNPENLIDKENLLVSLVNWLWQKNSTNRDYLAYLTNNFDIKKFKIDKKVITSKQAEKWVEAMKQEIDSLI